MATKKRGGEPDAETSEQNKRYKSAIDDAASDFVCPITQELPLDPVFAEDGHVYERHAIEDWLKRQQKSPLTNEPMGKKLVAAHGVKSNIRKLVASGAISGGKAEAWQQRLEEEAKVADLRSKAEGGDAKAMVGLANAHFFARQGLPKDREKAREWYERADTAGHPGGAHGLGLCAGDAVRAGMFLAETGARGRPAACVQLGRYLATGSRGFPKDKKLARRWYSKALETYAADTGEKFRDKDKREAEDWLRDHPA